MSAKKVAIVTGSNKGIGFAIVESLCKKLGSSWDVFATSRDEGRGAAAVKELNAKGVNPKYHQLDIDNKESIEKLASFIKSTYGGLGILVNNAGIAYQDTSTAPFAEQAEVTVRTNFWSTLAVCDHLFPLLRPHARVVHMGSTISDMMLNMCSPDLQKRLTSEMSVEDVKHVMTEFVEAAKKGTDEKLGWPSSALILKVMTQFVEGTNTQQKFSDSSIRSYGASKIGIRLLTYAQAKAMESDPRQDVVINGCCPGYVGTDLNSYKGHLTTQQGADTPVYLATLEPNVSQDLVGKHFYQRKVIPFAVGTKVLL